MNQKFTLIAENSVLLPDKQIIFESCKQEKITFEIPMTTELFKAISPDYVADKTYAIFYLQEISKPIKLQCKLYSNVLIIKGDLELESVGDLDVILYLRNPNKKLSKIGTLKITVIEREALEVYSEEEEVQVIESNQAVNNQRSVETPRIENDLMTQRALIDAILDVRSEVKTISQAYFEEEMSDRIGTKWYDGAGQPNNSIGIEGDYYINTINGDIFKFALAQ